MRTYALVVGINIYDAAGQPDLNGAVADACDFADWALDDAGGGVADGDLYFWTYPWPEPPAQNMPAPLPSNLRDYLDAGPQDWTSPYNVSGQPDRNRPPFAVEIVKTIEAAGRAHFKAKEFDGTVGPSRVLVFLAGHGVRARPVGGLTEETCFVAADFQASGSSVATGVVACESLKRSLLKDRFDEAHFFLDCCRVQTSTLNVQASPLADAAGDRKSRWTLALAAQDEEPAYETTGEPFRGAFSSALMDGLRTFREEPGTRLSSAGLKTFVRKNIARFTDTGQIPRFDFRPDDDVGPIIVVGGVAAIAPASAAAAPAPELFPGPFADLPAGTQFVIKNNDGPLPGLAPVHAAAGPVRLPDLPAGLYSLEMVGDHGRYAAFRVPGEEQIVVR